MEARLKAKAHRLSLLSLSSSSSSDLSPPLSDGEDVIESSDPADKQIKAIATLLQRLKKRASASVSMKKRFEKLETMLSSLQTRMRRMETDFSHKLEHHMTAHTTKLVSLKSELLSCYKVSMKELLSANRELQKQSTERLENEVRLIKELLQVRQCAPDPNLMQEGSKKLKESNTGNLKEDPEVQSKVSDCAVSRSRQTVLAVAGPNFLKEIQPDEHAAAASVSRPQAWNDATRTPIISQSKPSAPESRCCSSSSDAVEVQPKVNQVLQAKGGTRRRFGAQLRRVTIKFTDADVELLVKAIENLGLGRWQDVKKSYFAHDENHNASDIKDKWRSLLRSAMLSSQQRRSTLPPRLAKRILAIHKANNA